MSSVRRSHDRVGGSRLTGLGLAVLLGLLFTAAQPPQAVDRQLVSVVWAGLAAVFALGVVWPLLAVRRISVSATSPRDATVGELVPVEVSVAGAVGGCEVRALDPTGPWHRVSGTGAGTLDHLADRRGEFEVLRLEVRVTAPVGILAAHRVHEVVLPVPVAVGPRPLAVDWRPASAPLEGVGDPRAAVTVGGEVVRAVRPYAPGDPAHLVHWPSTARTGSLVVKELEPPAPVGQAIVVDLRDLGPDRERAASYACGAARAVLGAGGALVLCTAQADGPRTAPAGSVLEVGRRLARAVEGPPGAPPEGWPVVEIGR